MANHSLSEDREGGGLSNAVHGALAWFFRGIFWVTSKYVTAHVESNAPLKGVRSRVPDPEHWMENEP